MDPGGRQGEQQAVPAAGAPRVLPFADQVRNSQHRLLAVAEHDRVEEIRQRLRIERRMASGYDEG